MRNKWETSGLILILSAIIPFIMGLYKMYFYDRGEYYYSKAVNFYVGGDAYNYIINSNYATGFFVLAMGFLIAGLICIIIEKYNKVIQLQQESEQMSNQINVRLEDIKDYQQEEEEELEDYELECPCCGEELTKEMNECPSCEITLKR